jgi:two-component system response regulator
VNSHSILLIEDNANDEALTVRAIRKSNIRSDIIVARDGVEALNCLFPDPPQPADAANLPEVVLLDLKLPKVDGLEVLRRIRSDARTRLLPVVIFTSSHERSDVLRGYESGANSYVCKPLDATAFSSVLAALSSYWTQINEAP